MITKLGLDQTRFIIRLKGVNAKTLYEANGMDAQIYLAVREHIISCTQDWIKGATHWDSSKGPLSNSQFPLDGGSTLYVALGWSTQAKRHFITLQFNCSKLTPMAAIELVGTFDCMFNGGYADFFDRAECNYIELPLDVTGACMTDYLFFDSRLKSYNANYEANGTLYLGSDTSSRWWKIYDKGKQIADTGGPVFHGHWLRIEPCLNMNIPTSALTSLHSPYDTLCIMHKKKLMDIKHSIPVRAFRDRIFEHGLQPQAAYLKCVSKKELLEHLKSATPSWYDPTVLWETFPTVIQRVMPMGIQALADSTPYSTSVISAATTQNEVLCS